jgi:FkbM family methyltransferase
MNIRTKNGETSLLKSFIYRSSVSFGTFLCRHRRNSFVSKIINQITLLLRAAGNLNFDIRTNGEERALKSIASIQPMTVFDVGANVGEWAKLAGVKFPGCTVHAFEIVPNTYQKLKAFTSEDKNIIINDVGLSDIRAQITIHVSNQASSIATANKISSMQFHRDFYDAQVLCQAITGLEYLEMKSIKKIDLLKIDVEGMELKVLSGFGNALADVRVIQFEYGIFNISSRALLIDFFELLGKFDFVIGKIYPNFVEFFEYHFSYEDFGGHNYIAVKKSDKELIKMLSTGP